MTTTKSFARLSIVALLAACAPKPAAPPPPPDAAAIRTALAAELAKFPAAAKTKDAAAIVALFTDDATWILPDATTSTGHAAILAAATAFFGSFESLDIESNVIDKLVVISDSAALTFSHDVYTVTMKGKKPEHRQNPYADYWKKGSDGMWRVAYEINADGPLPAEPPKKP